MIPKDDFHSSWARVQYLTGWPYLIELSKHLGVSPGTVSKAKDRGEFPGDWAAEIAVCFNSSSDWILFGRGDARLVSKDEIDWPQYLSREERIVFKESPQQCSPAFGEVLKKLRVKHNMSLQDAAEVVGVTIEIYLDYERGYRPSPGYLNALAKHYKVNVKDLYNGIIQGFSPLET